MTFREASAADAPPGRKAGLLPPSGAPRLRKEGIRQRPHPASRRIPDCGGAEAIAPRLPRRSVAFPDPGHDAQAGNRLPDTPSRRQPPFPRRLLPAESRLPVPQGGGSWPRSPASPGVGHGRGRGAAPRFPPPPLPAVYARDEGGMLIIPGGTADDMPFEGPGRVRPSGTMRPGSGKEVKRRLTAACDTPAPSERSALARAEPLTSR
jgi:hypothetical protein